MKLTLTGPESRFLVLVTDRGRVSAKPEGDIDPYVEFIVVRGSSLSIFPQGTRKTRSYEGFKPGYELDQVVRSLGYEARQRRTAPRKRIDPGRRATYKTLPKRGRSR